jgi:hypothetical protein
MGIMAIIDVYVIGDSKFDLTTFLDSTLTWGDIGIKNVKDMADKPVGLCVNGDHIAQLRIVGHGNALGQYIGTDWIDHKSLGSHRQQLARMSPLFVRAMDSSDRRAHVVMGGCEQGRNGGLLLALSDIWNVPVSGFTAMQRPILPGDEGGETTCYITCTRQGQTAADGFDDLQLQIIEWFRKRWNK